MREPALRKHCTFLEHDGTELFRASLPTQMISVMAVNNEIGTQWNALDYASAGTTVHSDATQAIGKLPFSVEGLDFVSASSHKFYGPKGAGFLFCREFPPPPLILGGEQELGMRGGTLNVAGIVGMGEAARIASEEMANDIDLARSCKAAVLSGLDGLSDMLVHGGPRTSPYILSVSFGGVEGESVVLEADSAGYAISAGAACSSRSTEPSHVLTALGIPPEYLRGTLRISFGRFSDVDEAARLAKKIRETVEMFRTL
jgi:cysteine desulfurase